MGDDRDNVEAAAAGLERSGGERGSQNRQPPVNNRINRRFTNLAAETVKHDPMVSSRGMVREERVELSTFGSGGRRSIQLSYSRRTNLQYAPARLCTFAPLRWFWSVAENRLPPAAD